MYDGSGDFQQGHGLDKAGDANQVKNSVNTPPISKEAQPQFSDLPDQVDVAQAITAELWEIAVRRGEATPEQRKNALEQENASIQDKETSEPKGKETEELAFRRAKCAKDKRWRKTWQACHNKHLFGTCVSGGGIRSATFALGVLQGLTNKGLLQKAHYLSTVSGGGYIGSWLQGVLNRAETSASQADPYKPLVEEVPKPADQDPITFLRKYSNYLSPRSGFSIDMLLVPMIWSRNMVLNQAIIITAFIALLLPGIWAGPAFTSLLGSGDHDSLLLVIAILLAIGAVLFMSHNLRRIAIRSIPDQDAPGKLRSVFRQSTAIEKGKGGSGLVEGAVVAPVMGGVVLVLWAIYHGDKPHSFAQLFTLSHDIAKILGLIGLFAALQSFGGFFRCYQAQRKATKEDSAGLAVFHIVWMSAVCGGFTWLLMKFVTWLFWQWLPCKNGFGSVLAISYAPPLYVFAVMAGVVLQIGLMGRDFPDPAREWLARAGTLFWLTAAGWAGYFTLSIFAPHWIAMLAQSRVGKKWITSAVTAWLGSTAASVIAGKSGKTAGTSEDAGSAKSKQETTNQDGKKFSLSLDMVARYGPFVAVGGFLLAVAFLTQWLAHFCVPDGRWWPAERATISQLADSTYWSTVSGNWSLALLVGAIIVFVVLSWRVNINEFSMHHFYKNRLVRCYMGASAVAGRGANRREPDWFTGFDSQDDLTLQSLRADDKQKSPIPYPLLNATLNVTAGAELATQERKGLPWFFSPWYSGYSPARSDEDRFRRGKLDESATYARSDLLSRGISVGTAMAISGAAANPNWGSHSAPQTAFLLTLFNVRLGWWVGNPARKNKLKHPGPVIALWSLFRELIGSVDESSAYLNLSDGGHFENLGLYELVRRRCRYIIAIDGEEDKTYKFESLGGAVRKCREDFGVNIVINPRPIGPKDGFNGVHCAVGRIYYPDDEYPDNYSQKAEPYDRFLKQAGPQQSAHDSANQKPMRRYEPGWILYIKSSVTGDEPADVEEYRREHADFPQQSTADQFFTESQFESYRMLGQHVCNAVLDRYDPKGQDAEEIFQRLAARWEVPPNAPEDAFTKHAEAYTALLGRLAGDPELSALDALEHLPGKDRKAYFFWMDLIQLMEEIFVDLHLDDLRMWDHPAYAGWRYLFDYWAGKDPLKKVWAQQKATYGTAFRFFMDDLIRRSKK